MDLDTPDCDTVTNTTFDSAPPPPPLNGTFLAGRPRGVSADITFEKEPSIIDRLSSTFSKPESGDSDTLCDQQFLPVASVPHNATYDAARGDGDAFSVRTSSGGPAAGLNSTFNRSNSSGGPSRGDVAAVGRGIGGGQRKMSEDRLSSASSG